MQTPLTHVVHDDLKARSVPNAPRDPLRVTCAVSPPSSNPFSRGQAIGRTPGGISVATGSGIGGGARRWPPFTVGMDPPSERGASVESDGSPPIGGAQPSPWTGTAEGGPGPGSPDPRGAGALPPFPDWALWPLGTRPTGSRRLIPSPLGSQAPRMEKEFKHQFIALQPAHDRWQWAHPGGTAASEPLVTGRKSRVY